MEEGDPMDRQDQSQQAEQADAGNALQRATVFREHHDHAQGERRESGATEDNTPGGQD